jgi:hypothetical protein
MALGRHAGSGAIIRFVHFGAPGRRAQHGRPPCRPWRRSPFLPQLALPSKLRITRDNVRLFAFPGHRALQECANRRHAQGVQAGAKALTHWNVCSARSLARRRPQGDRRESGGLRPSTTGGPLALDKFSDWVLAARGVGGAQCASAHENRSADEPRLRAGGWLARLCGGNRALGCLTPLR